jgi:hypothetical protein
MDTKRPQEISVNKLAVSPRAPPRPNDGFLWSRECADPFASRRRERVLGWLLITTSSLLQRTCHGCRHRRIFEISRPSPETDRVNQSSFFQPSQEPRRKWANCIRSQCVWAFCKTGISPVNLQVIANQRGLLGKIVVHSTLFKKAEDETRGSRKKRKGLPRNRTGDQYTPRLPLFFSEFLRLKIHFVRP